MPSIKSVTSLILDTPPSCIEFVPGHDDLFVVGTYYLEKNEKENDGSTAPATGQLQQRTGSLLLFRLNEDEVKLIYELPTPFAIFDIHFTAPMHDSALLLGAATSTGSLALYQTSVTSITPMHVLQLFPTTSLITYFTWHPTIPEAAALALSDGSIYLCDTRTPPTAPTSPGDSTPTLVHLHAHALEAWCTAFTSNGSHLLTGGDDSALASIALPAAAPARAPPTAPALLSALLSDTPATVAWQDRKTHSAGVTAILPLGPPPPPPPPPSSNGGDGRALLLTGSYDDHVRLFALPSAAATSFPRRPALLAELDLGGGVWRLKDITSAAAPSEDVAAAVPAAGRTAEFTILASCMHAGARILRLTGRRAAPGGDGGGGQQLDDWEWDFEVLARFEEHRSMNYGSDVRPGSGGRTVVSTSFYDRLLAVWRW